MNDIERLKTLAARYAEIAKSPEMDRRREKWRVHNQLEEKTYPFHIEDNGTFFADLAPDLECEERNRWLEWSLVHGILQYEKIPDDRIVPDRFVVQWCRNISGYCDELEFTRADSGSGSVRGFESNKPIRDLDNDFYKLKKRTMTVDREETQRKAELAEEIFRGLLPVEIGLPGSMYSDGITNKAVHLMGMQELFMQMAINPDGVRRLFTALAEDNLRLGQQEERENLLTLNNDGNQGYCSGSSLYSDEVPGREITEEKPLRSGDRWGYLESQESTGISPEMFNEFVMPHIRKLAQFKYFKFGCCEPVHGFITYLQELPNLRKVSVTPWCDLKKLAGSCREDIIWSRKPVPLKLVGDTFDSEDFRAHLRETLDVGQDFFIEFVFRDTNRLTGVMEGRIKQACSIVREVTGSPVPA